ncbi:MAG: winged helix-turn-helix domain-containing protein [Thermoprotei archaeon]
MVCIRLKPNFKQQNRFSIPSTNTAQKGLVRRSRLETMVDILQTVYDGAEKPTHIMYRANLSWSAMQEYVDALIKSDLLREINSMNRKTYAVTEKAVKLLQQYHGMVEKLTGADATDFPYP